MIPRYIFILVVLFFLSVSVSAQTLTGKVVGITDGDTITILDGNNRQHKIRLYGIDTPESGQAFGKAAEQHTSGLVARKTVDVTTYDTDRHGRIVGVVKVNGKNVNQSLISAGYAWQYGKYCKASFCDDWIHLENKAKLSKIGLWGDADPVAPWEWRKGARNSSYSKKDTGTGKYKTVGDGFHGNTKSHVFHAPSCRHYNCKNCSANFSTREEAISSGYRPCGNCRP